MFYESMRKSYRPTKRRGSGTHVRDEVQVVRDLLIVVGTVNSRDEGHGPVRSAYPSAFTIEREVHQGFQASSWGPLGTKQVSAQARHRAESKTAHPIPLKFLPCT